MNPKANLKFTYVKKLMKNIPKMILNFYSSFLIFSKIVSLDFSIFFQNFKIDLKKLMRYKRNILFPYVVGWFCQQMLTPAESAG